MDPDKDFRYAPLYVMQLQVWPIALHNMDRNCHYCNHSPFVKQCSLHSAVCAGIPFNQLSASSAFLSGPCLHFSYDESVLQVFAVCIGHLVHPAVVFLSELLHPTGTDGYHMAVLLNACFPRSSAIPFHLPFLPFPRSRLTRPLLRRMHILVVTPTGIYMQMYACNSSRSRMPSLSP